jgi:hypothetical protein
MESKGAKDYTNKMNIEKMKVKGVENKEQHGPYAPATPATQGLFALRPQAATPPPRCGGRCLNAALPHWNVSHVRLTYQSPAISTFLSEQISHQ